MHVLDYLLKLGFKQGRSQHRFIKGDIYPIDIVPFGALAKQNTIAWPPDGDIEMNVLGFDEAYKNAVKFLIDREKNIEIPVASPAGLIVMKFIAWSERDFVIQGKE